MLTPLTIIVLGFFLGMRHATDPDHVIAVTTIVSRQRSVRYAAVIGFLWGIGHTITILAVGSAIILFKLVIPARLGLAMELSVGLMLILLGILNMSGLMRWITETFTPAQEMVSSERHGHVGVFHRHEYRVSLESRGNRVTAAPASWIERLYGQMGFYQILRPLAVGIVHGLAGSAAVALLVLTTIREPSAAMVYLLVFGTGTIAGMMLITAAIALPFTYSGTHFSRLNHGLAMASGVISFSFGLFVVYQMGFVHGLFSGHPLWIPR